MRTAHSLDTTEFQGKSKWKRSDFLSRLATAALVVLLASAGGAKTAWAGEGGTSASPAGQPQPASDARAADPGLVGELQQLRDLIQSQASRFAEHSKQLESERAALHEELDRLSELETRLGVTPDSASAGLAAQAVASAPALVQAQQALTPQDWSTRASNLEDRFKNFGPFSFSGDFRLRDEPFFGGPANQSFVQNRERFRLRFNITARLNDDISGGFSLASGDINDPTSTNQTINGFHSRKAVAIDKAYLTYTPHQFHHLTLVGGKFAYPWYNTELTWDKDLNPEGIAQTLVFDLKSPPVLKKVALVGFELPLAQVARTTPNNLSSVASVVYGGQLQTTWQLTRRVKFGAFTGFYNYHNPDPIALALATASSKNPQTPLTGVLPLGAGNTAQNSIVTTTATNVVTIGGAAYPTGVTNVTNAQFASKFGLFDSLARFDVTTPWEKWPIAVIGDYVQNTKACENVDNIAPKPANTASIEYSQTTNFACNARQRRGYWGEIQVGRAQKRGDWQFDYTRMFIEREAVVSNFNYSDIRQGSNVTQHRAMVIYQLHRNVQLSFTGLFGRPLNFGSTKPPENFLKRLQFDAIYTF